MSENKTNDVAGLDSLLDAAYDVSGLSAEDLAATREDLGLSATDLSKWAAQVRQMSFKAAAQRRRNKSARRVRVPRPRAFSVDRGLHMLRKHQRTEVSFRNAAEQSLDDTWDLVCAAMGGPEALRMYSELYEDSDEDS